MEVAKAELDVCKLGAEGTNVTHHHHHHHHCPNYPVRVGLNTL